MVHLKWEKPDYSATISEEVGELDADELFHRQLQKELLYDFRDDAIKRGAVNECVDNIRQMHRDQQDQVLRRPKRQPRRRNVKSRPVEPAWFPSMVSMAASGLAFGAFGWKSVIRGTFMKASLI